MKPRGVRAALATSWRYFTRGMRRTWDGLVEQWNDDVPRDRNRFRIAVLGLAACLLLMLLVASARDIISWLTALLAR